MIVASALAFVRTPEGTVKLHKDDTVPDGVAEADLTRLRAAGVIKPAPAPKPEPQGGKSRSGSSRAQDD